ncbi:MAG: TetR/AcrR family transcriptional regulator [Alcanivorax sp.]|nr:TetR/AcrR family transcriptional regulator [Alcanivorax sp.]
MVDRPAKVRRTQTQRREESIARLVQACIDCLVETGYHQTSTLAVARRAGLSQGALFRHFSSRLALLERTANELADRFIAHYRKHLDELASQDKGDITLAIRTLRDITRSPEQLAWFELQQAARTDAELCDVFQPVFLRNQQDNVNLAAELFPETLGDLPMMSELLQTLIQIFHGQTLDAHIEQNEEKDEQMLALTIRLAQLGLSVFKA